MNRFTLDGSAFGGGALLAWIIRTLFTNAPAPRTLIVAAEDRTFALEREERLFLIA